MLMAMLAVRNLRGEAHDLWAINTDDEYHEEMRSHELAEDDHLPEDLRRLSATQPAAPPNQTREPDES